MKFSDIYLSKIFSDFLFFYKFKIILILENVQKQNFCYLEKIFPLKIKIFSKMIFSLEFQECHAYKKFIR